jgi:diguanylate cyclase (GGDEF)-like protein
VFGDTVLVEFARILQENIKDVGFASRYGGQEFVAMIDKANKDDVLKILEKISEEYNDFSAKTINSNFTFSAGIVVDDKTLDLDEILATADDKLRQAKRAGKNQVVL